MLDHVNGDADEVVGSDYEMGDDQQMHAVNLMARLPGVATTDTAEWQRTIEKVVRNVVSIRFCQTCSFDTDEAITSEATGFVVDAERGYIMTNRHVVGAGPFWGYCVFDNHEECDVYPVYRDPIHDFGFLRFDPKAIKHMPVAALELRPDLAQVGVEIRVVGNDAGEKLSILSGVISRVDRNAPEYGEGYNDFNTNYIQAAASASGGSSGSPVVNLDGYAVALQAGGSTEAATDYFLPLDRPLRALQCLQQRNPVTRGTIQTQWFYKAFDECRRLGLSPEWESEVRKRCPKEIGMLAAEIVLPGGPADKFIEEGDILIKVNGELLTKFVRLDEILDNSVGQSVKLLLQRGGQDVEVTINVGDLHAITPDRYLTVCGASFHNLSYQYARQFAIPVKGVYVCEPAGSFRFDGETKGWMLESVDNTKTPDLDTFIEVMSGIPDRARVVVTYRHLRDLHTMHTAIIYIDRHWSKKMRMAIRNDVTGLWDFKDLGSPLPPKQLEPKQANFIALDTANYAAASDLVRGFVRIVCTMPIKLDGYPRPKKTGFGLVVDAEKGLVVVSRAIVPHDMCDITIAIAESILIEGKVIFMHPLQNYAIIQYDTSLVNAPVKAPILSEDPVQQGAAMTFLGFNHNFRVVVGNTTVTDITTVAVPACAAAPRYRAINIDAITVDTNLSSQCGTGVLADEKGVVRALWLTFLGEHGNGKEVEYHLGLATPSILPIIRSIQNGVVPKLRMLAVELNLVHMSQVRIMGISDQWIRKVEEENKERHQLFMVRKVECGYPAVLEEGDVILSINGKVLTRISELDVMYDLEYLDMVILRNCQEMELRVPTIPADGLETDRVVIFCGSVLHRPHLAVRQQISKLHSDIYVAARIRGSPASQYGLCPTSFVIAVNGVKTLNLTDFLRESSKIPDNTYFRLRIITFDNIPYILTMKKNEHYFPTIEYIKNPNEPGSWKVQTYENGEPHDGMEGNVPIEGMLLV
ncbi:trypsin-like serine protease [Terfezia boudieri ATCC MYA-4762]|uniref:Pro-apoptotic serine protease NMA111 n=1 Tax=Terfezia boudieri ATCC MYA-4762 TaxID=1051890 RepID=A0A3N4LCM6_9PEZI|nr:trypsin-like serine protease [Terfezia boudieri ATCC MYA-4762]